LPNLTSASAHLLFQPMGIGSARLRQSRNAKGTPGVVEIEVYEPVATREGQG